jgi:hypothetical protein
MTSLCTPIQIRTLSALLGKILECSRLGLGRVLGVSETQKEAEKSPKKANNNGFGLFRGFWRVFACTM